jgi:hypothetical protein
MNQILHLNRVLLEIQIGHLRSAHKLTEAALVRYDADLANWYEEQREVVDDDEIWEDRVLLDEQFEESKADAADAYPQILRASLFGTAYGIFEHFLNAICKQSHSQGYVQGLALKDLRGDGIQRAKLYLTKVAKITLPDTPEWQDLSDYGLLRNSLVHAQGYLAENDKLPRIEHFQKRVGTFDIRPADSRAVLLEPFNPKFLDLIETLGNQVELTQTGKPPVG